MTPLRVGLLLLVVSSVLSAGMVTADSFAYQIDGLGAPLGVNVTGVTGLNLAAGNGSVSFSIGTDLTDISSPGGKTLFSFNGPLAMWLSDFDYTCTVLKSPCGVDVLITASFGVVSGSPFTAFQASGAGSFTGPDGSILTLDYTIGSSYFASGQQQFTSPPPTFSFQDSEPLISNSSFLNPIVTFSLGIHAGGSIGNGVIGTLPGLGNATIPGGISSIQMPGQGFKIAAATPEPGPVVLLSTVMLLGFGARWFLKRH